MSLPVIWSPSSKDEVADLLQYVETQFGLDPALKLMDKIDRVVDLISGNPMLYPASDINPAVRKAVVTKQTSLFYVVTRSGVELLHFWDNRRDPNRLRDLL